MKSSIEFGKFFSSLRNMIVGNGSEAIEEKEVENDESKEVENDENNDKPNLQDKMIPNPQVGVPYYLAFAKFNQEVEERKMSTTTTAANDIWFKDLCIFW